MVRDQASTAPAPAGHFLSRARRSVGLMDGPDRRSVAADADQRGDYAGSWIPEALAFRTRYAGQSAIAAAGAAGAAVLVTLWFIRTLGS
jgi:hypothetical protein